MTTPSLTAALAKTKKLPLAYLQGIGVKDVPGGILIPYRLRDGSAAPRQRIRKGLSSKDGFLWAGQGEIVPYGLWVLGQNGRFRPTIALGEGKGPMPYQHSQGHVKRQPGASGGPNQPIVVMVEGESDAWTLWYHGYPAIGLPGSSTAKTLKLEHLGGSQKVFIWLEPDQGGEMFLRGITERLWKIGYTGTAKILRLDGIKDPSELHIKHPKKFDKIMLYLMASASFVEPYTPPEPRAIKKFTQVKGNLTEDQIQRAKEYPLEQLLDLKSGSKIICPNHDDQRASFWIKQYGYCFACGYQCDSIGWLMRQGMKFQEAVRSLQ